MVRSMDACDLSCLVFVRPSSLQVLILLHDAFIHPPLDRRSQFHRYRVDMAPNMARTKDGPLYLQIDIHVQ